MRRTPTTGSQKMEELLGSRPWRLVDAQTGRSVVESLELADGYWSRLMGWQLRVARNRARDCCLFLALRSTRVCCGSRSTWSCSTVVDASLLFATASAPGVPSYRRGTLTPSWSCLPELPTFGLNQTLRALGREGVPLPKSLEFLRG